MPLLQIDASTDVTLTWRIDASRARVWECLTKAGLVGQWLGEVVEGAIRDGADFVVDHGDNSCCQSTVMRYEEPYRLDFTWDFPDEPESTVAFQLEDQATSPNCDSRTPRSLTSPRLTATVGAFT